MYFPFHSFFLQNAMRAVMEHYGTSSYDFPKIKVLVTKGAKDVTIKVCII